MKTSAKSQLQLIWGVMLVLAGIGVIYRIPQVIPQLKQIEQYAAAIGFIYFCAYFVAVALIVGGGRKIYRYWKEAVNKNAAGE
jgi:hypothetical protein